MEKYKEVIKKIGLDSAEELIKEAVIPFLEEKIKDSESLVDDAIFAAVKPALMDLIDKIDGEDE